MNAYLKETSEEDYENLLNELYGTFKIGCCEFDAGRILRELDPIAFNCGMSDLEDETWICDECGTEFDNEDDANECCKPKEEETAS